MPSGWPRSGHARLHVGSVGRETDGQKRQVLINSRNMPVFEYRALQVDGKIAEGQLEADERQDAFRQMEAKGSRPIRLVERGGTSTTTTPDSPSNTSYMLAWVAGVLLLFSLFLPAVNRDLWLLGFSRIIRRRRIPIQITALALAVTLAAGGRIANAPSVASMRQRPLGISLGQDVRLC